MYGEDRLRAMAARAIEASQADETEVLLMVDESAVTRFASSAIHQNVFESGLDVRVRVALGQQVGVATTNQPDERSLQSTLERATEVARHTPENADFPGLPLPLPIRKVDAYSAGTAAYTPERRALDVKAICDRASEHRLDASGAWETSVLEIAIANSHGVWAYDARTFASLKTVIMGDDSSGYAERTSVDATLVDVEAAGREAVDRAIRSRGPGLIDPGDYTVVLEPYAVGTMIDYLGFMGLGAMAVQEGRSFMSGRFGEQIVGANVSLWDDGLDPQGVPMAFDFEGVPKQRVQFIDHGVATAVVYDSMTAAREGKASTGHASPAPSTYGPSALNVFMGAGEADERALLDGISRGLWVTRFHYVNVAHSKKTILTGMTRDGTFLIENGQVTRPVRNLRFTQSVLDALSNVEAIGRETLLLQDEVGGTRVPALRIGRFSFTSVTQF